MKHFITTAIFLAAAVYGLSSCDIKEERTDCKASIIMKAEPKLPADLKSNVNIRTWSDDVLDGSYSVSANIMNRGYQIEREKEVPIHIAAISGWPSAEEYWFGGILTIPEGEFCPELYGSYVDYDVTMDNLQTIPVPFRKLFTRIRVSYTDERLRSCVLEAISDVNGYEYPSLKAHEGVFDGQMVMEYKSFYVSVPKWEGGHPLKFIVWYNGGKYTLDLAKTLGGTPYDWEVDVAEDIKMELRMEGKYLHSATISFGDNKTYESAFAYTEEY